VGVVSVGRSTVDHLRDVWPSCSPATGLLFGPVNLTHLPTYLPTYLMAAPALRAMRSDAGDLLSFNGGSHLCMAMGRKIVHGIERKEERKK
jgi:hypothetical protein